MAFQIKPTLFAFSRVLPPHLEGKVILNAKDTLLYDSECRV